MNFHHQQPAYFTAVVVRYASLLALTTAATITVVGGSYFYRTFFGAIEPASATASTVLTFEPQTLKLKQYEEVVVSQVERQVQATEALNQLPPNPFVSGGSPVTPNR